MKTIWKLLAAIIVWAVVALVVLFVGKLLVTVNQEQIKTLGQFLKDSASVIGFLAGAAYFIWGKLPTPAA